MTFFESLLLLLLAAIALLQVARRLSLPYPAMLAGGRRHRRPYPRRAQHSDRTFDLSGAVYYPSPGRCCV